MPLPADTFAVPWQYGTSDLTISFGVPGSNTAIVDDPCRPDNAEWAVVNMGSFQEEGEDLQEGTLGSFIIDINRRPSSFRMSMMMPILLVILGWTSFFITRAVRRLPSRARHLHAVRATAHTVHPGHYCRRCRRELR